MRESEVTSWCQARIQQYLAYAMFSHRWGDREPRFRQMLDQSRGVKPPPTGPGYEKLLRFCEKAVYDYDCKYVWSDTCCINKESSTELEEAIRAMYKWYSDASVCIVHLARSSSIRDFPSEPWFTRGWTLQELLAPRRMRFYGRDWTPICGEPRDRHVNDKQDESILVAISRLTEIPQNDLRNFSPSCNRVSEKMRWAAKRATTKVEDIAYSLIGIFKVSMPIAYGEGTEAFYTLMKVIAGQCTEPWFFAWCGEPSPYSCALPSSPACYRRLDPAMRTNGTGLVRSSLEYSLGANLEGLALVLGLLQDSVR
ncbi:hypothetical protein PAXINDRAFT_116963 [Paxillus involutus ATCC 200175]|uniref:Heterokaryon incompatibility domain-containing protein n=1 Tax=Paxillus involutus ATCC 200175 TaxID=664439 RepID=A0A0C9TTU7_PAXIN|nr:hypothetical protein PAXINDRAFT_116963 [Paxillus involutus ATCC 200175]